MKLLYRIESLKMMFDNERKKEIPLTYQDIYELAWLFFASKNARKYPMEVARPGGRQGA